MRTKETARKSSGGFKTPPSSMKKGGHQKTPPSSMKKNGSQQTPKSLQKQQGFQAQMKQSPLSAQKQQTFGKKFSIDAAVKPKQQTPGPKKTGPVKRKFEEEEESDDMEEDEELGDEDEEDLESEEGSDDDELGSDEEESDEDESGSDEEEEESEDDEIPTLTKGPKQELGALMNKKTRVVPNAAHKKSEELSDEESDEDESGSDEEEEEESDDDEIPTPTKGPKQQLGALLNKKTPVAPNASTNAQKKFKTNEGVAVPVKAETKAIKSTETKQTPMPTKLDKKLQDEEEQRRKERDGRSLFVKNLPKGVSDDDIKALSTDIILVKRKPHAKFGWIMFANEQVCDKNYEKLKNAKISGKEFFVDFCGQKSKTGFTKPPKTDQKVDALKLFVSNIPKKATEQDIKKLFPTATSVFRRNDNTFAFASFDSPEKARQAFEKSRDASVQGAKLMVAYAKLMEKKAFAHKPEQKVGKTVGK